MKSIKYLLALTLFSSTQVIVADTSVVGNLSLPQPQQSNAPQTLSTQQQQSLLSRLPTTQRNNLSQALQNQSPTAAYTITNAAGLAMAMQNALEGTHGQSVASFVQNVLLPNVGQNNSSKLSAYLSDPSKLSQQLDSAGLYSLAQVVTQFYRSYLLYDALKTAVPNLDVSMPFSAAQNQAASLKLLSQYAGRNSTANNLSLSDLYQQYAVPSSTAVSTTAALQYAKQFLSTKQMSVLSNYLKQNPNQTASVSQFMHLLYVAQQGLTQQKSLVVVQSILQQSDFISKSTATSLYTLTTQAQTLAQALGLAGSNGLVNVLTGAANKATPLDVIFQIFPANSPSLTNVLTAFNTLPSNQQHNFAQALIIAKLAQQAITNNNLTGFIEQNLFSNPVLQQGQVYNFPKWVATLKQAGLTNLASVYQQVFTSPTFVNHFAATGATVSATSLSGANGSKIAQSVILGKLAQQAYAATNQAPQARIQFKHIVAELNAEGISNTQLTQQISQYNPSASQQFTAAMNVPINLSNQISQTLESLTEAPTNVLSQSTVTQLLQALSNPPAGFTSSDYKNIFIFANLLVELHTPKKTAGQAQEALLGYNQFDGFTLAQAQASLNKLSQSMSASDLSSLQTALTDFKTSMPVNKVVKNLNALMPLSPSKAPQSCPSDGSQECYKLMNFSTGILDSVQLWMSSNADKLSVAEKAKIVNALSIAGLGYAQYWEGKGAQSRFYQEIIMGGTATKNPAYNALTNPDVPQYLWKYNKNNAMTPQAFYNEVVEPLRNLSTMMSQDTYSFWSGYNDTGHKIYRHYDPSILNDFIQKSAWALDQGHFWHTKQISPSKSFIPGVARWDLNTLPYIGGGSNNYDSFTHWTDTILGDVFMPITKPIQEYSQHVLDTTALNTYVMGAIGIATGDPLMLLGGVDSGASMIVNNSSLSTNTKMLFDSINGVASVAMMGAGGFAPEGAEDIDADANFTTQSASDAADEFMKNNPELIGENNLSQADIENYIKQDQALIEKAKTLSPTGTVNADSMEQAVNYYKKNSQWDVSTSDASSQAEQGSSAETFSTDTFESWQKINALLEKKLTPPENVALDSLSKGDLAELQNVTEQQIEKLGTTPTPELDSLQAKLQSIKARLQPTEATESLADQEWENLTPEQQDSLVQQGETPSSHLITIVDEPLNWENLDSETKAALTKQGISEADFDNYLALNEKVQAQVVSEMEEAEKTGANHDLLVSKKPFKYSAAEDAAAQKVLGENSPDYTAWQKVHGTYENAVYSQVKGELDTLGAFKDKDISDQFAKLDDATQLKILRTLKKANPMAADSELTSAVNQWMMDMTKGLSDDSSYTELLNSILSDEPSPSLLDRLKKKFSTKGVKFADNVSVKDPVSDETITTKDKQPNLPVKAQKKTIPLLEKEANVAEAAAITPPVPSATNGTVALTQTPMSMPDPGASTSLPPTAMRDTAESLDQADTE